MHQGGPLLLHICIFVRNTNLRSAGVPQAEKEKLKAAQAQKQESEVKAKHNQLEAAKQQVHALGAGRWSRGG